MRANQGKIHFCAKALELKYEIAMHKVVEVEYHRDEIGQKNISPHGPFYISDEGRWRKEG